MTNHNDIDALAAEYVLGSLSPEERKTVSLRRRVEQDLDQAIRQWELRLSPLDELSKGVEPPPHLHKAIVARIERDGLVRTHRLSAGRNKWVRPALAIAAILLLAIIPLSLLQDHTTRSFRTTLQMISPAPNTADLAPNPSAILRYPEGELELSSFFLRAQTGFEHVLWLARNDGTQAIRVGVLPRRGTGSLATFRIPVASLTPDAEHFVLFVTLEPEGAPADAPNGPRILEGRFASFKQ